MTKNLATLAETAFEARGDYDAIFFEDRWLRSGEAFRATRAAAAGLIELGIQPGDRVIVLMANTPDVGIAYGALWAAGAVITPVVFLLPPQEIAHILRDSGAVAVITTHEFISNVTLAAEGIPTLKWIIASGNEEEGVVSLAALKEHEPAGTVPRADDDLAALLYTGGTTGQAKGVMLTHANLYDCAQSAQEAAEIPGVARTIVPLPLSHAFGLIVSVAGLHQKEAAQHVLMRWFDPAAFCALVAEHRMQRATVIPTMLQLLLGQRLEDHDLSSLTYINCGAAPLSLEVVEEFERRVPSATILEGYGLTESGAVVSVNPPDRRKLGTVGLPIPRFEVRVEGADGAVLPSGEVGEICVRGPGVMTGYWESPEATAETLRDGWLHTGDLGSLDEDGYITIADRKKDLIIRGGFNVFPRDVEDALLEHPSVAMAGVVGRPHPTHGEEVIAFVSVKPDQPITSEELIAFMKDRVGAVKYPREIRIVDAIPLTPIGKIDRKALRETVRAG